MEIYALVQNVQCSDGDSWQHWVNEQIVSYHRTRKGAELKIKNMILSLLEDVDTKLIPYNPHIPANDPSWEKTKQNIRDNVEEYQVGSTNKYEKMDVYFIKPIKVED